MFIPGNSVCTLRPAPKQISWSHSGPGPWWTPWSQSCDQWNTIEERQFQNKFFKFLSQKRWNGNANPITRNSIGERRPEGLRRITAPCKWVRRCWQVQMKEVQDLAGRQWRQWDTDMANPCPLCRLKSTNEASQSWKTWYFDAPTWICFKTYLVPWDFPLKLLFFLHFQMAHGAVLACFKILKQMLVRSAAEVQKAQSQDAQSFGWALRNPTLRNPMLADLGCDGGIGLQSDGELRCWYWINYVYKY